MDADNNWDDKRALRCLGNIFDKHHRCRRKRNDHPLERLGLDSSIKRDDGCAAVGLGHKRVQHLRGRR